MTRRGLIFAAAATASVACLGAVSAIDPGESHVAPPVPTNALPAATFVPHAAMPHSGLPHWQHDEHPMVQGQTVGLPAAAHGNSRNLHPTKSVHAKESRGDEEDGAEGGVSEKSHIHTPEEDAAKVKTALRTPEEDRKEVNNAMLGGEEGSGKLHTHTPEEDASNANKQMLRGGSIEEKPALLELEPPVSDSVPPPLPQNHGLPPHSFIPGSGAHSGLPHWQAHEHPHAQGHLGVPHLPSASHGITHNLHHKRGKNKGKEEQEDSKGDKAENADGADGTDEGDKAKESSNESQEEKEEEQGSEKTASSNKEESFIEKKSQNPEEEEEDAGANAKTKLPPHYLRGNGITGETVIPGAMHLQVSAPPAGVPPPNYISGAGIAGSVPIIGHQQSGIPQKISFLEEQSKDPDAMKPEDGGLLNPPEEQFEHPPNGGLPAWSANEHPFQNGFVPGRQDIHMNAHSVFVPLHSHPPAAEHAHLGHNLPHNGMMPGRL